MSVSAYCSFHPLRTIFLRLNTGYSIWHQMSTFRELNFTVNAQLKGIELIIRSWDAIDWYPKSNSPSFLFPPSTCIKYNTIQYIQYIQKEIVKNCPCYICEWVGTYIFKLWYSTVHKDNFDAEELRGISLRLTLKKKIKIKHLSIRSMPQLKRSERISFRCFFSCTCCSLPMIVARLFTPIGNCSTLRLSMEKKRVDVSPAS